MGIEAYITRWTAREGGAERANYQMFLSELCDVLEVPRPDPSGADRLYNDYVFERAVRARESDGGTAPKRIDLYKRGALILEAKQSRLPGHRNAIPGQLSLPGTEPERTATSSPSRSRRCSSPRAVPWTPPRSPAASSGAGSASSPGSGRC